MSALLELESARPRDRATYEIFGEPDKPVVAVLGGISASRHIASNELNPAPGWWEACVGEDRPVSTATFRILGVDYRTDLCESGAVSTADQAGWLAEILDAEGIGQLHAIVGASYGGMVALAFGAAFPERVGQLVVISAGHETRAFAAGLRFLQRRIVELGVEVNRPKDALVIARGLAMTSYSTADEFQNRFPADGSKIENPADAVGDYLTAGGESYAKTCTAERFLALSKSLDEHRVAPENVHVPTTLIAVRSDALVSIASVRDLAGRLGAPCDLVEVDSASGHDAFLNDPESIFPHITRSLGRSPRVTSIRPTISEPRAKRGSATRAVRAGIATDLHHGAVVPPIHLSSTFSFDGFGRKRAYDYTRSGNPTRDYLAAALADLEGGAAGIVTSSGMSAVALALQLVRPGELVLAAHDCYGGTHRILRSLAERGHFQVVFTDLTRTEAAEAQIAARRPRLLWIETPSNPLLRITDLERVVAAGHSGGAIVAVDNTFLSPALQQPLRFGADLVVHSTTKYLNGHSDVVGGAVVSADSTLGEELGWWANCLGLTGSPFDSFLTLRGVRTLGARMRVHLENAELVVAALRDHPAVALVHYPGLESHPGHHVAARQQDGFGAMASFELRGGVKAVERVVNALEHFTLAESLGGVESLVAHPATMTHASMDESARLAAGIGDGLLRLSIGIEDGEDLVADLIHALDCL